MKLPAKFRAPALYISFALVVLALGFSLLVRDLKSLVESQRAKTEALATAVADLLPRDRLELSLKSKETESPEKRLLKESLLQIRLQLQLSGFLHVVESRAGEIQVLASTQAGRLSGDSLPIREESQSKLKEGLLFTSGLHHQAGSYWIQSFVPLLLPLQSSEAFLVFESQQDGLAYRLLSLGSNYLLVFVSVLALAGIFLFVLRRQEKTRLDIFSKRFEQIFFENSEAQMIVDHQGQVLRANPAALHYFDSHLDDLEGVDLFAGTSRFSLASLDGKAVNPKHRISQEDSFVFKAKIINMADEAKFVQIRSQKLSDSETLLRFRDLSQEIFNRKVDGLDALEPSEDSHFYDELTGLPNFNYLRNLLETRWNELKSSDSSLLIIDLDDFKDLKKSFGQDTTNKLLQEFSSFLRKYFRQSDNIVHYTEDKFIILLSNTDLKNAERIACTLLETAKKKNQDRALFSIGAASLEDDQSAADWISRAAAALQTAKTLGKGRVEVQRSNDLEILPNDPPEKSMQN